MWCVWAITGGSSQAGVLMWCVWAMTGGDFTGWGAHVVHIGNDRGRVHRLGCSCETLRKYPSVPNLERMCTKEYEIPETDVTIDEGTLVMIPSYALHHDPEYFPDPEKFDPDRFSKENKNSFPQYTYLPFGEGPRICIGMRFGLMQVKVGLATLLSKYEFSICEKSSVPLILAPVSPLTTAKDGIWLKISPRDS
uniref:Cytochrome P450 n=1 Tax=Timema douglasi TaxID=61478 RepID=A0A7R8ZCB9_TIMDO|nr:unnamed protein product [Timema douglasi]